MGIFKSNRDLRQENDDLAKCVEELQIIISQLQHENDVYKSRKKYVEDLILENETLKDKWRREIADARKARSDYEALHKSLLQTNPNK